MPLQYRRKFLSIDPGLGFTVDWSHPSANGLIACILMNEQGGPVRDIINFFASTPSATPPTWSIDQLGVGRAYVSASSTLDDFGNRYDLTVRGSIMAQFMVTTLPSAVAFIAGKGGTSTVAARRGYNLRLNATNVLQYVIFNASGGFTIGGPTAVAGKIYTLVGTYDGATQRLYLNGVLNNSASNAISTYTTTASFQVGGTTVTGGGYLDASINTVYVWNRALSNVEVEALYVNPYQIVKPISAKRFSQGLPPPVVTPLDLAHFPDYHNPVWTPVEY